MTWSPGDESWRDAGLPADGQPLSHKELRVVGTVVAGVAAVVLVGVWGFGRVRGWW